VIDVLKKQLVVSFVIFAIMLISSFGCAAEKPIIELLPEAEVTGKDIYLADVAKFTPESAQETLGSIYLGAAALPGSSRRLTLGQIEVRLRQAGIDPRNVEFTGAAEVRVSTRNTAVSAAAVTTSKTTPDINTVNSGEKVYTVVVPVRDIARHEIITEADLAVEQRQGKTVPSNLASLEDLIGKRATRLLPAGQYLTVSAAEVPPVVERGDYVTLLVTVGSIQVTTLGQVRQAGGIGEIVAVENVSSRTIVYGKVISSDLVKIEIGGQ